MQQYGEHEIEKGLVGRWMEKKDWVNNWTCYVYVRDSDAALNPRPDLWLRPLLVFQHSYEHDENLIILDTHVFEILS
jgi:hypothetical protein